MPVVRTIQAERRFVLRLSFAGWARPFPRTGCAPRAKNETRESACGSQRPAIPPRCDSGFQGFEITHALDCDIPVLLDEVIFTAAGLRRREAPGPVHRVLPQRDRRVAGTGARGGSCRCTR